MTISPLSAAQQQQQQIYLKTVSIHNSLQLAEIKKDVLCKKEPIILIARITPIMEEKPEEGSKLLSEFYSTAIKNDYSVFKLGEERIIIASPAVQVGRREKET
jgi:SepF-like predicted cell division protein (DUF552 family)